MYATDETKSPMRETKGGRVLSVYSPFWKDVWVTGALPPIRKQSDEHLCSSGFLFQATATVIMAVPMCEQESLPQLMQCI